MISLIEDVLTAGREAQARVWSPVERLGFVDWCEANIVLDRNESKDYAGPYSREMVPTAGMVFEEFLDADDGERWQELFVAKGTQSTFTAHALMATVRHVETQGGNVVYAIDSNDSADTISDRFRAFLKGSPATDDIVAAMSENDLAGREINVPGQTLWFTGAGSAGQLAGKPGVDLVWSDEPDKHRIPKKEARTNDLLRHRGKATKRRKFGSFCSPTEEDGQIWPLVKEGSGHRHFVPCPECDELQYLKMDQVKYLHLVDEAGELDLERVRNEAVYECECCGRWIEEHEKRDMLLKGELRPTNFKEQELPDGTKRMVPAWKPGVMSFYHSDLYALWEGSRWGDLAADKHLAGKDPMKLRDFINGRLGEAWVEGVSRRVTLPMLKELKGTHLRGRSPFAEPATVFCAADTQDDCWKATICAFDKVGTCYVVDWGLFISWDEVVAFAKSGVQLKEETESDPEKRMTARAVQVDEGGHRTMEVRKKCLALQPVFIPSRGLGGANVTETLAWRDYGCNKTKEEEEASGVRDEERIDVLVYNDDGFRWLLYITLILNRKKIEPGDRRLVFPKDVDDEFLREFTHEFRKKKGGKWGWTKDGVNDFADAVKMCLILWEQFGAI